MSGPRRLAILPALVKPALWLGCDRTGLIMVGTCAAALAGPGGIATGKYVGAVLGFVFFALGTAFLRVLGKKEPQAEIYIRVFHYRGGYVARGRWDADVRWRQR